MEAFFREVMDEARRLGLAWWERLALVIAAALLVVAARRTGAAAWDALRSIEWKVEPGTVADEGGIVVDRGAREGGGPAGGSDTGGMG